MQAIGYSTAYHKTLWIANRFVNEILQNIMKHFI